MGFMALGCCMRWAALPNRCLETFARCLTRQCWLTCAVDSDRLMWCFKGKRGDGISITRDVEAGRGDCRRTAKALCQYSLFGTLANPIQFITMDGWRIPARGRNDERVGRRGDKERSGRNYSSAESNKE